MSFMAVISVVIPALNDSEMLATCLAALRAQTRPADEIIVVDNGSTDDTADVARAGGARVVTEPKRGVPAATSTGFDAARGTVIGRLDADSLPDPDWLARIEYRFDTEPDLAAITGPARFYGAGRVKKRLGEALYLGGMHWAMDWLLGHPMIFGSNFAISAKAWNRIRTTSHRDVPNVHDDLDLSLQMRPGMRVEYDRELRVSISARPFDSFTGLVRRVWWVWTTLSANSRERPLLERRAEFKDWQRGHLAGGPTFVGEDLGTADLGDPEFGSAGVGTD